MGESGTMDNGMRRLSGMGRWTAAAAFLGLAACDGDAAPSHVRVAGGDPVRGRETIERYGCIACHVIPGFSERRAGSVGPPLHGIASRSYIAGILPNWPPNMVSWLLDPPAHAPRTAMPDLGLDVGEARDVAAYLYSTGGPRYEFFPSEARSASTSVEDRQGLEEAARRAVGGYGWADPEAGLARIPVERAIELLESGTLSLSDPPP